MFGFFEGPSKQQNEQFGKLTDANNFATNLGENNLTQSSDFMSDILSGDSTKISAALAPQIGTAKTAAQQQNKTTAEFGTRSGGNAASTAMTNDKIHSDITSIIGQLTGSSASGLMSAGSSLFSAGQSGTQSAFSDATQLQKQRAAKLNGIFGDALNVGSMVTGGLSGMAASPAGANQTLAFLGGAGF